MRIKRDHPAFDYLKERFIYDLKFTKNTDWDYFEIGQFNRGTSQDYHIDANTDKGDWERKWVDQIYYMTAIQVIDSFKDSRKKENPPDLPKCVCDIQVLMRTGCKCGGV